MAADRMPRETPYGRPEATVVTASPRDGTTAEASDLRVWHQFDWRFLLPDPHLGAVWLAPVCAGEGGALRAMGFDVVSEPDDGAEVGFVDGSRCDFSMLERALPLGALVRISVVGVGGLRGLRHKCSWDIAAELEARGWQVLGRVWAIGGLEAPLCYVDLDNRHAVTHWWRNLRPRGARARMAVAVRLALARFGSWRLLCHEGFLFARTPM